MAETVPRDEFLIGREVDLEEIEARLRSRRLVTLVGPGGVGKTAAARAVARRVAARLRRGVRFVDLTRVDAPEAVAGTLASQLGFASFEALLAATDLPDMVIVDNCEHVLDAAAATIGALLDAGGSPGVLATSRSPLDLEAESVVVLAPLPVPAAADPAPLEAAAVRLFLARASDAGVAVRSDELPGLVELARRLDGLPLALEIAAARLRSLTVADLLECLDDGVDVLHRRRFRGSGRHRSVADLVSWSIALLGPAETDLLERLAFLSGPFRLEDVMRLVADGDDADAVGAAIEELVRASLVAVDRDAERVRFRLLATVRACLLARLRERGLLRSRGERFADRVIARVRERLATAGTRWDPHLVRDVVAWFDDLAGALRWCIADDDEPQRAMALCGALFAVVQQGRAHEIHALVRQAFARWPDALDCGGADAASAWGTWATTENLVGNPQRAIELAERGLAAVGDDGWAAVVFHRAIGQSRVALFDRRGAARAFAAGSATGRRLGLTAMALELELANAQIDADAGAVDIGLAAMERAGAEARRIGSEVNAVWADTLAAWTTVRREPRQGLARARAALAAARAIDYPNACAGNLRTIAFAHLQLGDPAAAAVAVADLVREVRVRGSLSNVRMVVDVAAVLAWRTGRPEWAALAATAQSLPPATAIVSPGYDIEPLPAAAAVPLSPRAALATVEALVAEPGARGLSEDAAAPAPGVAAAQPSPPAQEAGTLRRRGDVWEVAFAGRSVGVRAGKAMTDLAVLLAEPGRQVHCLELFGAPVQESSTGDVIDAVARRQYEARLRDLEAEIGDAEATHDLHRAECARAEFEALLDHLSAALGLGGRTRRAGASAERARSAVTQRLRALLRHLDGIHPELGRHLRHAIRTGTHCCYAPERDTVWTVDGPAA